jgi:hypothetical protein
VGEEKILRGVRLGVWGVVWGVVYGVVGANAQTRNGFLDFLLLIVWMIVALLVITIIQILYDAFFIKFYKISRVYTSDEIKLKGIKIK